MRILKQRMGGGTTMTWDWSTMISILGKQMTDAEKALLFSVMFQHGVLPVESPHHDMDRALQQMSPVEARKAKRKFRKLWRKLARAQAIKRQATPAEAERRAKAKYGKGHPNPNRNVKNERKILVVDHFQQNFVRPLLDNLGRRKPGTGGHEPT